LVASFPFPFSACLFSMDGREREREQEQQERVCACGYWTWPRIFPNLGIRFGWKWLWSEDDSEVSNL
jgi:hypothetical protein